MPSPNDIIPDPKLPDDSSGQNMTTNAMIARHNATTVRLGNASFKKIHPRTLDHRGCKENNMTAVAAKV